MRCVDLGYCCCRVSADVINLVVPEPRILLLVVVNVHKHALVSSVCGATHPTPPACAQVEKMRVQYTVGCLYVDSKRLKSELGPITVRALDNMKALLQDVSREKCREVLNLLTSRTKILGT